MLPMNNLLFSINFAAVSVEQQKYAKIGNFFSIIGGLSALSKKIA